MRAGKRNDTFPNSYTNDPLVNYRRVVRTAGWPSWNMLYLDSGPMIYEAPPEEPEEGAGASQHTGEDPNADPDGDAEADEEAAALH